MNKDSARNAIRFCKSETCDTIREFGEVTSLHGVRFVTERKTPLFEKICWIIAISLCLIWCGIEINKINTKWHENPVITSLAQKPTSVSEIPFPAITICPETKVLRSKINVEENYNEIITYLKNNQTNRTENLINEAVGLLCDSINKPFPDILPKLESIKMIEEIAPRIEDIFESCTFHFVKYNCSDLFRPLITNNGLCYVFNILKYADLFTDIVNVDLLSQYLPGSKYREPINTTYPRRDEEFLGPASGLKLILKLKMNETQDICTNNGAENFKFTLHSPEEFPFPSINYFHVSPNTQVMVTVRPEMILTEPNLMPPKYTPKVRGCTFPQETGSFSLKTSTKNNAFIEVSNKLFYDECNCSVFQIPLIVNGSKIPFCTKKIKCNHTTVDIDIRGLLPSCNELKYRSFISPAKYKYNNGQNDYYYAKVTIFFEDGTFFPWKKSELFGFTDLLASCGGLLGLFSGFSLITGIEIIYFSTIRILCGLRRRSKLNRENNKQINELKSVNPINSNELLTDYENCDLEEQ